jgi:hypothetical protein
MKLSARAIIFGGVLLLPLVAVIGLRAHFEHARAAHEAAYQRDAALDRDFDRRKPLGIEVRVMLVTDHGSYGEQADRPSFRHHIASVGKLPVILDVAGCGFPDWLKGVPMDVAMLSVDENPAFLGRPTTAEACNRRDASAVDRALRQRLDFLMRYVDRADWIDRSRVMLSGSGEAAPVVAAYSGYVKSRMTLGDPCLNRWRLISTASPMTMLFTDSPQGLAPGGNEPSLDLKAIEQGAGSKFPPVEVCTGVPRPAFTSFQTVVTAPGRLGIFERPQALLAAQAAAYRAL